MRNDPPVLVPLEAVRLRSATVHATSSGWVVGGIGQDGARRAYSFRPEGDGDRFLSALRAERDRTGSILVAVPPSDGSSLGSIREAQAVRAGGTDVRAAESGGFVDPKDVFDAFEEGSAAAKAGYRMALKGPDSVEKEKEHARPMDAGFGR